MNHLTHSTRMNDEIDCKILQNLCLRNLQKCIFMARFLGIPVCIPITDKYSKSIELIQNIFKRLPENIFSDIKC